MDNDPVTPTRTSLRVRRMLMYASLAAITLGTSLLVRMLIWSYRLDDDFSGSYACCTQQAVANFHQQFWARFFIGAKVVIAGCLLLSATLPSRAAFKRGLQAVGAAVALVFLCFIGVANLHGWSGPAAMTISGVVFCGGAALLLAGGCRLGWTKLRCDKRQF
jgi:hypothetical protein